MLKPKDYKSQDPENPLEVLPSQLSEEALLSIIESFVLREGTDYGVHEISLDKKVQQIYKQIQNKEIKIIFDQTSETVNLVTQNELTKMLK